MTSYTFTNVTQQGLNVTWIVGTETKHKLVGSEQVVQFDADSLTAETQSLIDNGYLVQGGTASTVAIPAVAAVPVTLVGPYQSAVQYKKGQVVLADSIYYIALRTSVGATPSASTSDWKVFGGPSTGSLGSHVADTSNPHSVTAAQLGAVATSLLGAANGVATLDASSQVPLAQIPDLTTQTQVAALLADQHTAGTDQFLDFGGGSQVAASDLATHLASSANPHSVTATQVGAIPTAQKAAANGVASLDANGDVPVAQLTLAIDTVQTVADIAARDALTPKQGDQVKVTDVGDGTTRTYTYTGAAWQEIVTYQPVTSVNTLTGAVVLDTDDVGEGSGNLYYTEARVIANTNVAANTAARHTANTDTILDEGNPNEVTAGQLRTHLDSVANPHAVTAAQVGAITAVVDDTSPELGGELNAASNKIVGLADPTLAQDAATKNWSETTFLAKLATYQTRGGSYVIQSSDSASIVRFSATATATLPQGFPAGFQVVIANVGAGTVTIAAAGAGSLQAKGTTLTSQYSASTWTHIGSDIWEGFGDLN